MAYLHGIEVQELGGGVRSIRTVDTAVIGIVGTAPDATPGAFEYNKPTLVLGRSEAGALGATGTLPAAIDSIFDQVGVGGAPQIVVVRVDAGADSTAATTNVIGGVNAAGDFEGLQALLAAQAVLGVKPKIIIAPGFTQQQAVATEVISLANKLAGFAFIDGPNTTDADAVTYRENFDAMRAMLVDPMVFVRDAATGNNITRPGSAVFAGVCGSNDVERGFWTSCSNRPVNGITGIARAVSFGISDAASRANALNANEVSTFVREKGWRTWGSRTMSADQKWAFMHVRRTADAINESLLAAHLWAVDRNLTKTYFEEVIAGVEAYMRTLQALSGGAIIAGKCWADKALNSPTEQAQGNVYFDFDFAVTGIAEHITFRSRLNNNLLEDVLA
jgi:uncharacterized protein